ncbi:histidine kinase [Tolypothrix tenuis PCC 7101]|uniref:histidine kinase n=1 Tax=Tolypothrix tenuis PCC 7101 TaxID=231146 RepID=A0A1Z4N7W5_9CYAN|nr:HAMP domain-containing histidine kinase [Aulosira sp. FACHB-113]BAZ01807.1 histidine kinase [Tolypothrix tenuis PCC 7101]BAZ74268.1 histidine kinase [Aulosira laxa NIES-50]
MDWINWVYLGSGLALGISLRWLFPKSNNTRTSNQLVETTQPQHFPQLQQTQLAYEMAKEMSQFKAGFLARTTHELRSPLNGLIGLHQLILSDLCENPEEEREFVAQAHERALKLLKLMDEVLNVARVEHGTNKLDIQPLSLKEVLQEVDKLIYMLAANRNFKLQVSPPDLGIYVLADPRWLRQVLISLVDTSISQMEEGGISISSALSPNKNSVYIWLDVPIHTLPGSESIDFIKSIDFLDSPDTAILDKTENSTLTPGMRLLLNQTLLEEMGGKLEIVPFPTNQAEIPEITRLQVSIPLVIPEAEFPQPVEAQG